LFGLLPIAGSVRRLSRSRTQQELCIGWYIRYLVLNCETEYTLPSMHHLIYLSQATRPLSANALTCLVEQARQANERQHITGALVYGNKRFIQVLEGEQAVLAQAYARISQDPRHMHLCRIADYPIGARHFAEWSLAFQALSPAQFAHLAGYLAPTQLARHLPVYNPVATSFLEAIQALVQAPAAK
jgi:hypothetical protein